MELRDQTTAYLLWFCGLFGLCGLHRFYTQKPLTGLLWLLTGGLCGLGQLVDLVLLPGQVAATNTRLALRSNQVLPALPPKRRMSKKDAMGIQLCRLAKEMGGAITVSDGVLATGRPHQEVEKVLDEMARARWVDIGNHPESGVVVYRFTDFS